MLEDQGTGRSARRSGAAASRTRNDQRAIISFWLATMLTGLLVMLAPIGHMSAMAQEGEFDVEDPFAEGAQADQDQADQQPGQEAPVPWQVRIGNRAAVVDGYCQPLDFVVLVPDEATFLDAISLWGFRNGRFPVLIEDDVYTPMFIRRYRPDRVFRWPSVGANTLPSGNKLRERMLETVAWIWRHPNEERPRDEALATGEYSRPTDIFQQAGWTPPGVVVTSENDSAWPAAVALAAGYGQPIAFLDGDFGHVNDQLSPENFKLLEARIENLVKQTGYSYLDLGDDIDTVTVVREIAARYRDPADTKQVLAVTDGLARKDDLFRWGIAGWIYGSSARSVYMTMSSLFLTPNSALCFDSYPEDNQAYLPYRLTSVPSSLQIINFEPMLYSSPDTTIDLWHQTMRAGFKGDVIILNSSGNAEWFNLAGGTRGYVVDVPIHNVPAWVYCVHSWSAQRPADVDTIAGRWIDNGAVSYVGAVNEPFLQGFIPAGQLAERLKINAPFIVSSRYENAVPWKIMTLGDPLMTFKPKGRAKLLLSKSEIKLPANLVDLNVLVGVQAGEAQKTGNWAPFFDSCSKLARDELAVRIYLKSVAPNPGTPASERDISGDRNLVEALHTIIPALAHEGELDDLARAVAHLPKSLRRRREVDMLWARADPLLDDLKDPEVIETLVDSIRAPFRYVDAARIAPTVARILGPDEAQQLLAESLGDVDPNDAAALAMVEEAGRKVHAISTGEEIADDPSTSDGQ